MSKRGLNKKQRTQVKKLIYDTSETKFHSETASAVGVSNAGADFNLNDISQGDSATSRDGNQILITGLYQRFILAKADSTNIMRLVVYIPRNSVTTTLSVGVNQFIDMDKYTVLMDKLITLNDNNPQKHFTFKKSFKRGRAKGMITQWASGTSTDWTKNPLKLYVVSDSSAASHPTFSMISKTFFKDK